MRRRICVLYGRVVRLSDLLLLKVGGSIPHAFTSSNLDFHCCVKLTKFKAFSRLNSFDHRNVENLDSLHGAWHYLLNTIGKTLPQYQQYADTED